MRTRFNNGEAVQFRILCSEQWDVGFVFDSEVDSGWANAGILYKISITKDEDWVHVRSADDIRVHEFPDLPALMLL